MRPFTPESRCSYSMSEAGGHSPLSAKAARSALIWSRIFLFPLFRAAFSRLSNESRRVWCARFSSDAWAFSATSSFALIGSASPPAASITHGMKRRTAA